MAVCGRLAPDVFRQAGIGNGGSVQHFSVMVSLGVLVRPFGVGWGCGVCFVGCVWGVVPAFGPGIGQGQENVVGITESALLDWCPAPLSCLDPDVDWTLNARK